MEELIRRLSIYYLKGTTVAMGALIGSPSDFRSSPRPPIDFPPSHYCHKKCHWALAMIPKTRRNILKTINVVLVGSMDDLLVSILRSRCSETMMLLEEYDNDPLNAVGILDCGTKNKSLCFVQVSVNGNSTHYRTR